MGNLQSHFGSSHDIGGVSSMVLTQLPEFFAMVNEGTQSLTAKVPRCEMG